MSPSPLPKEAPWPLLSIATSNMYSKSAHDIDLDALDALDFGTQGLSDESSTSASVGLVDGGDPRLVIRRQARAEKGTDTMCSEPECRGRVASIEEEELVRIAPIEAERVAICASTGSDAMSKQLASQGSNASVDLERSASTAAKDTLERRMKRDDSGVDSDDVFQAPEWAFHTRRLRLGTLLQEASDKRGQSDQFRVESLVPGGSGEALAIDEGGVASPEIGQRPEGEEDRTHEGQELQKSLA